MVAYRRASFSAIFCDLLFGQLYPKLISARLIIHLYRSLAHPSPTSIHWSVSGYGKWWSVTAEIVRCFH